MIFIIICTYIEIKSTVIQRFQVNLEEWNTQMLDIAAKKKRNGKFFVTAISGRLLVLILMICLLLHRRDSEKGNYHTR